MMTKNTISVACIVTSMLYVARNDRALRGHERLVGDHREQMAEHRHRLDPGNPSCQRTSIASRPLTAPNAMLASRYCLPIIL